VIIEQLSFSVRREHLDHWLVTDAAVWDEVLAAQAGYLGKEVWITDAGSGAVAPDIVEVQVIVRWTDRATWKAIDDDLLTTTHALMGEHALSPRETVHITVDDPERTRSGEGAATPLSR
jgi:uncharacterized protein (TIGR03792 family)